MKSAKQLRAAHRQAPTESYLERRIGESVSSIENNTASLVIPSALAAFVVLIVLTTMRWFTGVSVDGQLFGGVWCEGLLLLIYVAAAGGLIGALLATRSVVRGFEMAQISDKDSLGGEHLSPASRWHRLRDHLATVREVRVMVSQIRGDAYYWAYLGFGGAILSLILIGLGLWAGCLYTGINSSGG